MLLLENKEKLTNFSFIKQKTLRNSENTSRGNFPPVKSFLMPQGFATQDYRDGFRKVSIEPVSGIFSTPGTAMPQTRDKDKIFTSSNVNLDAISVQ